MNGNVDSKRYAVSSSLLYSLTGWLKVLGNINISGSETSVSLLFILSIIP